MDPNDLASEKEEILREEALAYRKPTLKACGWCHNCNEQIGSSELFCLGVECRDDYQKAADARRRNGGAL
ncbi:hypothetical protein [Sulfuriferula sp.]|uniref:hypothetical protein n=1 Tax=Sulfuriferula sp. TaxID=2025307 RepID=UPI00272EEDB0|nr:hypothetical protein [Sulfuriferula sp.]MDP2026463.1 hypothetical protein [Sulfuriferula sp.]